MTAEGPQRQRDSARFTSSLLGVLVGGAGAVFVVRVLVRDWPEVRAALVGVQPGWLGAAFLVGLISMAVLALGWGRAMTLVGTPAGVRDTLRWYFVGQLGKYVPGGVWSVVGPAELATGSRRGRVSAYGGVLLALGAAYLAATITVACLLVLEPGVVERWAPARWLLVLIPIGMLAVHPRVLELLFTGAARVLRRPVETRIPRWGDSLLLVFCHVPAWLGVGFATWCVGVGLGAAPAMAEIVLAAILSWVVGFLVVPAPGGLGVREAVFVLAAGSVAGGVAAAMALLARVLFVAVDAVGALVFGFGNRMGGGKPGDAPVTRHDAEG